MKQRLADVKPVAFVTTWMTPKLGHELSFAPDAMSSDTRTRNAIVQLKEPQGTYMRLDHRAKVNAIGVEPMKFTRQGQSVGQLWIPRLAEFVARWTTALDDVVMEDMPPAQPREDSYGAAVRHPVHKE
ncbi:hypothetical protein U9M48_026609 [Paspalum notatum var. saurae]|uniref:Uncharacterized protein n=1 Tax=Paspalum notatum var. saurae TaxID=547442 RepID=A0AAQ3TR93_PASNO